MDNPLRMLSEQELRRRTGIKWHYFPPDVLPVWVAEMDVPLAEPVARALTEAIALGDTGYPETSGYAAAFADFAKARWGWELDAGRTAVVPHVMQGVVAILELVTGAGDAIIVNPPVYPTFYLFLRGMDRRIVDVPLTAGYRLDLDALDAAFARVTAGGRRAAYLLCSPHNPTGTVHTREELAAVSELAARHRVRVVVDEIHAPLVYPEAVHLPYLSLPGTEDAFVLLSASKAWNLAGLKAAITVAGQAAADELAALPEELDYGVTHLGAIAQTAALWHGREWLDALLAGLDENRRLLADLLAEHLPQVGYRLPQATYLAWLDCRALDLPGDPAEVFLERGRVGLSPGPPFGPGGAGHARLNFATSPELLTEAVRRMAAAVSR